MYDWLIIIDDNDWLIIIDNNDWLIIIVNTDLPVSKAKWPNGKGAGGGVMSRVQSVQRVHYNCQP